MQDFAVKGAEEFSYTDHLRLSRDYTCVHN